jgi:hypothetical protein
MSETNQSTQPIEKKERNRHRPTRHRGYAKQKATVCVFKGEDIQLLARTQAAKLVDLGWSYCPRSKYRASKNKSLINDSKPVTKKVKAQKTVKPKAE